jgi:glycerol uptake facilitator-like aquaporin
MPFVAAQLIGGFAATLLFRWMVRETDQVQPNTGELADAPIGSTL